MSVLGLFKIGQSCAVVSAVQGAVRVAAASPGATGGDSVLPKV